MSRDNVEIVRRAYEAYNRRDVAGLQEIAHPDCTVQTLVEGQIEPEPFRGREGVRAWIENEQAIWRSLRIDDLDVVAAGPGHVRTYGLAVLSGRESGLEMRIPVWSLIELRDGKMFRLRSYGTEAEADAVARLLG